MQMMYVDILISFIFSVFAIIGFNPHSNLCSQESVICLIINIYAMMDYSFDYHIFWLILPKYQNAYSIQRYFIPLGNSH